MRRRDLLAASLLAPAAQGATGVPTFPQAKIDRHDAAVDTTIERQITDKNDRCYGSIRSEDGLHHGGTPAGMIDTLLTGLITPQSRHYKSARVAERLHMAAQAFGNAQTKDGNWNNPITNFNSPADSAFIVQGIATNLMNARQYGFPDLEKWLLPAVQRAGDALVRGGIHTPNHRWVACSALAGLYKLYQEPKYLKRAEQWLAEGIDMDADDQYTERSPVVYNGVTNRALLMIADWLDKPEYLDYVRRNLNASLYLLHADGEVVTEISRRQDLNTRGTLYYHWLPLQYLACKDMNGQFATVARELEPAYGGISAHLRWPWLMRDLPPSAPLPDNFDKHYKTIGFVRIRRGPKSVTILKEKDRFLTFRKGRVVINAIRFSSAFFGKGQFKPSTLEKQGNSYVLTQQLEAAYYQPFEPTRKVTTETFDNTRNERRKSEICRMEYRATFTETPEGGRLRIQASGTDEVPLTVEINLREGTEISGAEKDGQFKDSWILKSGYAELTAGGQTLKIGPGKAEHRYLVVRGAMPRLEGPSIFLTGLTPFDHTIEIR